MNNSMSDAILEQIKGAAYEAGIRYALEQLRDVYGDGITETDLFAEYASEENK